MPVGTGTLGGRKARGIERPEASARRDERGGHLGVARAGLPSRARGQNCARTQSTSRELGKVTGNTTRKYPLGKKKNTANAPTQVHRRGNRRKKPLQVERHRTAR